MQVGATLAVDGPRPLLEALGRRLADTVASECPAVTLRRERDDGRLRFTLQAADGLPYPQLVAASISQPECVFTLDWADGHGSGRTTIRGGLVEAAAGPARGTATPDEALRTDSLGALVLGTALLVDAPHLLGYAATRRAETYFRVEADPAATALLTVGGNGRQWDECWSLGDGGRWLCTAVAAQPIDKRDLARLDELAADYRARWLWFDADSPEQSIIERTRAVQAGIAVHAINVQSRARTSLQRSPEGGQLSPSLAWVTRLLALTWAAPDIPDTTPVP